MPKKNYFNQEVKTTASLATMLALRITGLCMIIPILDLYSGDLKQVTPFLIGLAIGIYGITQAVMQIPLGILSDKIGRKPVITLGLIVFCIGSLIAASANSIYTVIVGRSIQGAGAISSVVLALATDLISEKNRVKSLAAIGASIGIGFAIALALGPLLAPILKINGLFLLTAALAVIAMIINLYAVPKEKPNKDSTPTTSSKTEIMEILKNKKLMIINIGIFNLHFLLTLFFIAVPKMLVAAEIVKENHWLIYLYAFFFSFIVMIPMMIIGSKNNKAKFQKIFKSAIILILIALVTIFLFQENKVLITLAVMLFFAGFNYLEASFPSLIAQTCPINKKGAAMGVYSSFQFIGAFLSGIIGGFIYNDFSNITVVAVGIILSCFWLIAIKAPETIYQHSIKIKQEEYNEIIAREIKKTTGVIDALFMKSEEILTVKASNQFNIEQIHRIIENQKLKTNIGE